MENALRACCQGVKLGKILVHRCGTRACVYGLLQAETQPLHTVRAQCELGAAW